MIVKNKLLKLRADLRNRFGEDFSKNSVKAMTDAIRRLGEFSESGVRIAELIDIETDYYYIFTNHNYFIYRITSDSIIIVNMFNEKEDFMMKLFGVSGRSQESIDYWGD